jgi:anti-sigma-K factor RskA
MQHNIQEYIDSGILEQYATGSLPPPLAAEVELMTAQHPEIAAELTAVQTALEQFAMQYAVAPPPSVEAALRQKLFNAPTFAAVPPPSAVAAPNLPSMAAPQRGYLKYAAAILAFSLGLNGYFYYQWQNATQQVAAVQAEMRSKTTLFTDRYEAQKAGYEMSKGLLADVANNSVRSIKLAGIPANAPTASAIVYWRESDGRVVFDPAALPPPPSDKQYQLWAIIDGKPVDAGMVAIDGTVTLQAMKDIKGAVAFAVTLEKMGGSPTPTMEAMYVMGKV